MIIFTISIEKNYRVDSVLKRVCMFDKRYFLDLKKHIMNPTKAIRSAARAIIIKDDSILLVQMKNEDGEFFILLVAVNYMAKP